MRQIFPIVPASNGPIWFFIGFAILLLGLLALFSYFIYSSRNAKFEIDSGQLNIAGDIYGRRIPLSSLELQKAKVVNLKTDHDYRMKWRTNGTGLPGYSAGWFRLYNGDKCLAFVTDRDRVIYIPTRNGYSLLLSVQNPEQFLKALQTY
jgi:hypothetical protein